MQTASIVVLLLAASPVLSTTLRAQQPDELDRRDNERVRYEQLMGLERDTYAQAADIREAFVKNEMKEAQKALDNNRVDFAAADRNFVSRIPEFHRAVANYRTAVKGEVGAEKILKELNHFVDVFKTYFNTVGTRLTTAPTSDFKELSRETLLQQTLAAAEHIDAQLDQAGSVVQSSGASNKVTVQSELFLRQLHGEIYRLGTMISKLK